MKRMLEKLILCSSKFGRENFGLHHDQSTPKIIKKNSLYFSKINFENIYLFKKNNWIKNFCSKNSKNVNPAFKKNQATTQLNPKIFQVARQTIDQLSNFYYTFTHSHDFNCVLWWFFFIIWFCGHFLEMFAWSFFWRNFNHNNKTNK